MGVIDDIRGRVPVGFLLVFLLSGITLVSLFVPLNTVLGPFVLAFVLFVPGYALLLAFFPELRRKNELFSEYRSENENRLTGIERLTFSFVLSIVIVPLIGYGLNYTIWGVRREPVFVSLLAFTAITMGVGLYRWWTRTPTERRQSVHPYRPRSANTARRWLSGVSGGLFGSKTTAGHVLSIVLVLSVVLALGSVAYAVSAPQNEETYTEFYLLTEDDTGELVADDYPEEFVEGDSEELVVGIENREHETTTYSVVVLDQQIVNGDIVDENEQQRFETTLEDGEAWQEDHEVSPTLSGEEIRMTYLLYEGEPPDSPSTENADDSLYIRTSVSPAGQ